MKVTTVILWTEEITRPLPTIKKNAPFVVLEDDAGSPCKHSIFFLNGVFAKIHLFYSITLKNPLNKFFLAYDISPVKMTYFRSI